MNHDPLGTLLGSAVFTLGMAGIAYAAHLLKQWWLRRSATQAAHTAELIRQANAEYAQMLRDEAR